ncbi:MAG: group 1 truncated hemoglobin [Hyphomicrobiales bacterium]|nr:group 1 truncated hemoglobin [Hyphomicrobiales bacterium]MCP5374141.1 group 1 truncated hemoglobin [Hyphomicrobiales bacterium]
MAQTPFDRYGGFASVSRIVSEFYDKVLDSPLLAEYFQNVDMRSVIDHQTKFIASIMGGPASYSNDHLERVHANLGITEAAFNEAVALLRETFEDFDLDESDIAAVVQEVVARKNFIVVR